MKLVIIESPFAGDVEANIEYLHLCMKDSLRRGEAPYASHMMYTKVLDDTVPADRALGITAGLCWGDKAELTAVYIDRGLSNGMRLGIQRAEEAGRPIVYRKLLQTK